MRNDNEWQPDSDQTKSGQKRRSRKEATTNNTRILARERQCGRNQQNDIEYLHIRNMRNCDATSRAWESPGRIGIGRRQAFGKLSAGVKSCIKSQTWWLSLNHVWRDESWAGTQINGYLQLRPFTTSFCERFIRRNSLTTGPDPCIDTLLTISLTSREI